jgi:hypothetical protein
MLSNAERIRSIRPESRKSDAGYGRRVSWNLTLCGKAHWSAAMLLEQVDCCHGGSLMNVEGEEIIAVAGNILHISMGQRIVSSTSAPDSRSQCYPPNGEICKEVELGEQVPESLSDSDNGVAPGR